MPVTFGAVSQHLGVLRAAGFVTVRSAGNHRFYRADRAALGPLAQALEAMWSSSLDRLPPAVAGAAQPPRRRAGRAEAPPSMPEADVIRIERRVDAPPSAVFRYLTESELWARWQG